MPPGTRHRSPGPLAGIADPLYLLPSEGRAVGSLDSDGTNKVVPTALEARKCVRWSAG